METITVYKFKFFYSTADEETHVRFVVVESADEAWNKITTHFEQMHRKGYAKPVYIANPTVEIQNAII